MVPKNYCVFKNFAFFFFLQIFYQKMLNRKCLENISVKRQENLRIITKLDLSSCNIRGIYPGTFKDLVQLKKINLSNNNIVDIHQDTFKDLVELEQINLSNNNIVDIHQDTFKDLVQLKKINLSNNNIVDIHQDTFKDLVELEQINLSNNNIVDIHQDTFKDLFQLTHIDLKYNKELINNNELKLFFEDNVKEIHLRDRNSISQIHNVDIFLLYYSYLSKKLFYSFFSYTITK
jgi:Leucine-rich repeat (LRR) protein